MLVIGTDQWRPACAKLTVLSLNADAPGCQRKVERSSSPQDRRIAFEAGMGEREGQGWRLNPLPLAQCYRGPGAGRGESLTAARGVAAKVVEAFSPSLTALQTPLFRSRFLLRRSRQGSGGGVLDARLGQRARCGFTVFQCHLSLSPMDPWLPSRRRSTCTRAPRMPAVICSRSIR